LEEKRPRARHRFDFSGKTRSKGAQTTTDQILKSLNRQAQPARNIVEDQENMMDETAQIAQSDELVEYSRRRGIGSWLFGGMLLGVVAILWTFGLIPRILYADTVGSIGNLLSMVPSTDLAIIMIIWVAAMIIGLLGRRARHATRARLS